MSAITYDCTPANVTYYDVVKYLMKLVSHYVNKYHLPWDEAQSEVNLAFVESRKTFDRTKSKFITWVGFNANNRLRDMVRNRARKGKRTQFSSFMEEGGEPQLFSPSVFCDGFSEDAKIIVRMLLDSPPDMVVLATRKGKATPTRVRCGLRKILAAMDWTNSRINRAFVEIRKALG